MGAVGATALAAARRRLTRREAAQALLETTKLSTLVMFVLIGSTVFSLIFQGAEGSVWVERLFVDLPGGATGFLLAVTLLIFVLGFFLDFFEIAFILLPLLSPIAQKLGIDLIWFGVLLGVNMQTSFMHPPFGFALFYLRSVAPKEVKTSDIYRGAIPFVLIQVVMVTLIIAFPQLVSVEKRADMKEKLELHIDMPPPGDAAPDLQIAPDASPPADDTPQLNFSTEGDKK